MLLNIQATDKFEINRNYGEAFCSSSFCIHLHDYILGVTKRFFQLKTY